jgi:hypothetical protein
MGASQVRPLSSAERGIIGCLILSYPFLLEGEKGRVAIPVGAWLTTNATACNIKVAANRKWWLADAGKYDRELAHGSRDPGAVVYGI